MCPQPTLQHFKEEEEEFLPKFSQLAGNQKLMELGQEWKNAAGHAVTRPHPSEPNKPPLNVAAHMAAYPMDVAADKIRGV